MTEKSQRILLALLHRILTEEINMWDPEGLLACGAPEDEYAHEIGYIFSRLYRVRNTDDLAVILNQEMIDQFASSRGSLRDYPSIPDYVGYPGARKTAKRIWRRITPEIKKLGLSTRTFLKSLRPEELTC